MFQRGPYFIEPHGLPLHDHKQRAVPDYGKPHNMRPFNITKRQHITCRVNNDLIKMVTYHTKKERRKKRATGL